MGLLKDLIERPRPPAHLTLLAGGGYALPSTHAAFTPAAVTAMICVTSWRAAKTRRIVSAALSAGLVLIGLSMVYLGSHWAGDVIVGWALGAAIGSAYGLALRPRSPVTTGDEQHSSTSPATPSSSTSSGGRHVPGNARRSRG